MEPRRAAEAKDFPQAARIVRDRDFDRGLRHVHVDAPGRRARERDGAGYGEDAGRADGERRSRINFTGRIEAGRELLYLGRGAEFDAYPGLFAGLINKAVAIVILAVLAHRDGGQRIVRQDDGLVYRLAGAVQAHRDRAADGQPVQTDQAGFAVGVDGVTRGGAGCGRGPLHQPDRGVGDQQADGVWIEYPVGVAQCFTNRQRTQEDLHVARAVERHVAFGLDGEVALQLEERRDRDGGIEYGEAHHLALGRRELDHDHAGANRNRLVDRPASGVDLQQHVAAQRGHARVAGGGVHRDPQRASDTVRREDETALPLAQVDTEHAGRDVGGGDPHRPGRRNGITRIGIGQRDLLEGEVAAQAERRRHRRVGKGDAQRHEARQAQVRALLHREGFRGPGAVDGEGLVDRGVGGVYLDRKQAGADGDIGAATTDGGAVARQFDTRCHALLGDQEVAAHARQAEHRIGRVAEYERQIGQRKLDDRGTVGAERLLEGDETGEGDFRDGVGVEIETDGDIAGGGNGAGGQVENDRIAAPCADGESGAAEAGSRGLEIDHRCWRAGLGGTAGARRAGPVDRDFEAAGTEDDTRHANQRDAGGACPEGVIAGGVGRRNGFEQRQPEVQIGDRQTDRAMGGRIVLRIEHAVAIAVRVSDADKGIHVAGAHRQHIDGLAGAVAEHHRLRGGALDELEVAADVDEVVNDECHAAEGPDHVGRVAQRYRGRRQIARAIRVAAGLYHQAAVGREAGAGSQIQRLCQARVIVSAVYLYPQHVGADGDAIDAHHLGRAAGADRVITAVVGGGVDRLEQRQREIEVAQHEAHGTVAVRRVLRVDDAVAVGVDKIRPTHAHEGVDVGGAYGHHVDLLGGRAAGDAHGLRRAALAERELAGQVQEVGHRDRDITGHLEQVALGKVDQHELVGQRPGGHLEPGRTAPGVRIGGCTRREIDGRRLERAVLALVDGNGHAAGQCNAIDPDQAGAAGARQGKIALGAGRGAGGHDRLGKHDGQIVYVQ